MIENKEKNIDKRLLNLKPCKPGETNNPNGRPKGQRNYATIRAEAIVSLGKKLGKTEDEIENELVEASLLRARKGDFKFYKDDLDRLHGTATIKTDITTNGKDLPTPIATVIRD
jgi:hypothetical protein